MRLSEARIVDMRRRAESSRKAHALVGMTGAREDMIAADALDLAADLLDLRAALIAERTKREKAEQERDQIKGAIHAQDTREAEAGQRCDVPRERYGCDWPDAMADAVLEARHAMMLARKDREQAEAERDRLRAENELMREALESAREYIEAPCDPVAMAAVARVDAALARPEPGGGR